MKYFYKAVVCAAIVSLASCSAPKKVPYVVDAEVIPPEVLAHSQSIVDPLLAPGDLLNIQVTSSDMVSVAMFNKGMYVSEDGSIRSMTNNNSNIATSNGNTTYYLVNSEGEIDFPMLGYIQVAGKTKGELANYITNEIYPRFLKIRPQVEVRLMNFSVVVTGAVNSPGIKNSTNERMNFFEAIALAGDLNLRGERENILLYRTNPDGTREVHRIDIHDKDFLLSPYFNLQQNDIIYVVPNKHMASGAWGMSPAVGATLSYIGLLSSVSGLIIGVVNLAK